MTKKNDYLKHYGIKGQQWYVRRYQNEDGTYTEAGKKRYSTQTLKAGTKFESISTFDKIFKEQKDNTSWKYVYNPNDEWDSKIYKGPFALYKGMSSQTMPLVESFETIKDLKMPTREERIDKFKELYQEDQKKFIKTYSNELDKVQKLYKTGNYKISKEASKVNMKKLESNEDFEAAYEIFGHLMENSANYKMASEYSKRMSKAYDAMVDDNNVGIYNRAKNPIIIFDQSNLKRVEKVRVMDMSEIEENVQYVRNELEKYGETVAL